MWLYLNVSALHKNYSHEVPLPLIPAGYNRAGYPWLSLRDTLYIYFIETPCIFYLVILILETPCIFYRDTLYILSYISPIMITTSSYTYLSFFLSI